MYRSALDWLVGQQLGPTLDDSENVPAGRRAPWQPAIGDLVNRSAAYAPGVGYLPGYDDLVNRNIAPQGFDYLRQFSGGFLPTYSSPMAPAYEANPWGAYNPPQEPVNYWPSVSSPSWQIAQQGWEGLMGYRGMLHNFFPQAPWVPRDYVDDPSYWPPGQIPYGPRF
jgi:hypothetical protein